MVSGPMYGSPPGLLLFVVPQKATTTRGSKICHCRTKNRAQRRKNLCAGSVPGSTFPQPMSSMSEAVRRNPMTAFVKNSISGGMPV